MTEIATSAEMATTHQLTFTRSRPWTQAEFEALLESPLVFATGDAKCFAMVRVIADEAELLTLATHPKYRRQGLAIVVMQNWHRRALQRGAKTAFLEVASDNQPALSLYRSCGYEETGLRKAYYARGDGSAADAILLRRSLI
ncbi:ribosomal-protein-alanine acetyltransferase, putative [Roseobacter sp. SK209-2-6]|uniref:GNAT family N-acetyltransferase n=1 Tax=Roseobacter sp. SK209-2-6 TaxID=388739 RepID=UPI0000F3D285|nr:GNAT family N-acetyltransferase [Roseobacter sp. SK209-2-6]EBA14998.1 ribosomal-protein-alanine acetyltransferase, putative [Roseobacter sp. SK209-2-6]